jgi:hypothetical protein
MIRKIGRVRLLFDREAREARRMQAKIRTGEVKLQTVDYTPSGFPIAMPESLIAEWDEIPPDVREKFLREVDANRAGATPTGMHSFEGIEGDYDGA